VKEISDVLHAALCSIVVAQTEAIPAEAKRARARDGAAKRRDGCARAAAAAAGTRAGR